MYGAITICCSVGYVIVTLVTKIYIDLIFISQLHYLREYMFRSINIFIPILSLKHLRITNTFH